MSVRADGWSKEDDEGPLKLKDLHKKIQEEQRGKYLDILRPNLASYYDEYDMYDYDYEESRRAKQNYKPKRDTRRDRPSEDGFSYVESGSIFEPLIFIALGSSKKWKNKPKYEDEDEEEQKVEVWPYLRF